MATNEYTTSSARQEPPNSHANYQSYNLVHPPAEPAPSYHQNDQSQIVLTQPRHTLPTVSPFEGPFDDHVHPLGGQQHNYESHSTLPQDPRSYRAMAGRSEGVGPYADSIPLRDNTPVPPRNAYPTDHVYDAPLAAPAHPEEARDVRRTSGLQSFLKSKNRVAWVTYILTLLQCTVFVVEIIKNAQLTGSPIEIQPFFNPMIGPSTYVLINMGARYVPCMHAVDLIQTRTEGGPINWPCPNTTSTGAVECQLNDLCGFNMPASQNPVYPGQNIRLNEFKNQPNQWFRFITPIFLHAGIIHIGFNMLLQMTLGKEMEIAIGPIRYFLVYISAGIFGFVLGGNFAATGIASTGASGALFGILALNLLDLLYTWRERKSPMKDFAFLMLDVIISFVLGLLPGLDNFSHIGGFFMGLVLGICILHSPNALRKRISHDAPPYRPVSQSKVDDDDRSDAGMNGFLKSPIGFFHQRKLAWWAWWLVRAGSLFFVFIVFILLLNNFYTYRKNCSWCKYLSCININNWCEIGNLQLTTLNSTTKRSVFDSWESRAKLSDQRKFVWH